MTTFRLRKGHSKSSSSVSIDNPTRSNYERLVSVPFAAVYVVFTEKAKRTAEDAKREKSDALARKAARQRKAAIQTHKKAIASLKELRLRASKKADNAKHKRDTAKKKHAKVRKLAGDHPLAFFPDAPVARRRLVWLLTGC